LTSSLSLTLLNIQYVSKNLIQGSIKTKKGLPIKAAPSIYQLRILSLDNVHIHAGYCTVEVSANHLLAVASHHALAGCEVFWLEDSRSDD